MPDFNKYTNYTDNTSFSGVVYGANAPVLEVEQNEMQEIFNTKLRGLTDIIGDCIIPSTGGSFSYANSSVSIRKCIAISHGFIGFVDSTDVSVSSVGDHVYVKLEEKTVTKSTALKEYGNVNGSSITNPIQDNRVGSETSRRKMIEVSVLKSSSALQDTTTVHYVLVGELTSSEVFTFKHVLTSNLVESINTLLNLPSAVESAENTAESAYNLAQGLSGQISSIIAQSGTSDTEVVAARTNGVVGVTSNTLKDRLDNDFYSLQESIPVIDSTFSRSDASAPAKETGNRLRSLETGIEGKQDTLLFDEAPLENSQHPVKSGGVFNVTKGTITSVPNVTGMTDPNKKYLNETDGYLYEYDTTTATWKKKILPIQTEVEEIKEDLSAHKVRIEELEAGGSGGLSKTAVNLLNTILSEAVYGSDQTANIESLHKELSNVKPVSITATLTSRALVGMRYSELTFEITATFDDESTLTTTDGYRVTTTGTVHSGSNTVTVSYRGVTTNVTFEAEQVVTHTITYNLTDVSSSNMVSVVVDGAYYSTTLSVKTDYGFNGCTVTMGGVDITSSVYGNMEILVPEVTGDVVITASATAYTYVDDLIRIIDKANTIIAYSDNYQTQISRVNYHGTAFVTEYPAISDCNLHWVITNNTDSAVSLVGVCIGAIPCNETYPPDGKIGFSVPYSVLCANQSGTLEAGASVEGDYVLRAGHQLAYLAQASSSTGSAEKLTLRIRGNYRANEFSDYEAFQINNETPHYGGYRMVNFYSDNGETLISTMNGYPGKITDTLSSGTYNVYARICADYAKINISNNKLISGAVADATDNASNYAYGKNTIPFLHIWYNGQMTVSSDGMTIISSLNKNLFANDGYADFRFKEVNT